MIPKQLKPLLFMTLLFVLACQEKSNIKIEETYLNQLKTYKENLAKGRITYLQIAGLFKLDSLQTFGKSKTNDIVFQVKGIPERLGTLIYKDTLYINPEADLEFTTKTDTISSMQMLPIDTDGNSLKMHYKHVSWQVITRSGNKYLRVWDENNSAIDAFKGFTSYKPNPKMIFKGDFTYYDSKKEASVKSQLGLSANTNFIGKLKFTHKNKTHHLEVGPNGFTMVGDSTSGNETYGGGRYIYLDLPASNGNVTLDFNYLYNPPCSYNSYTTCLYPPRQNHLPFKILAGETIARTN
ncbi:MAG: DUF1684 domain-containing protein [Flavobacteriaceae bacterium]|nr:DUF1684 domain-containing protein [Flavobacteriaceae bacterium]